MYNNVISDNMDEDFSRIKVSEPTKNLDKVVFYKIVTFDSKGIVECTRRYSDFIALRDAWKKRIPGLYYPFLPPKKIFGNTDKEHLEERCFLLEQFLKKVYRINYLVQSEELSVFCRTD
jgi:PX domain